jgi:hypothetical protein
MRRRRLLRAGAGLAAGTVTGLAGCLGLLETRSARTPPLLDDRPDAVYFPTHVEETAMVARTTAAGDEGGDPAATEYGVAVMYSYPHRFWTMTGEEATKHSIDDGDLHLMTTVWDTRTRTVLPEVGVSVEILREGDLVGQEVVYPMLSQPMGFHYGGNFTLSGDGTYRVRVSVAGASLRRTGTLRGRFGTPASATVSLEYSRDRRDALSVERTPDRAGTPAAVDPREMPVPRSVAPAPATLPGRLLGTTRVGEAVLSLTLLDDPPAGVDTPGPYLAVSARTPYNRTVLPRMGVAATVAGERHRLDRTLDPQLGYHYGTTVTGVAAGDRVVVDVETPPQVARHEGYETAFRSGGTATLTVE